MIKAMTETTESTTCEALFQAIENQTAKVGVIGLGYVGLPLILSLIHI